MRTEAETKAFNLHTAMSDLLGRYKDLIVATNSEPTFGEDEGVTIAARALYDNQPLADWEPSPLKEEVMALHDRTMTALERS